MGERNEGGIVWVIFVSFWIDLGIFRFGGVVCLLESVCFFWFVRFGVEFFVVW